MELRIGDYVRTKSGYISKYIGKNKTPYVGGKHLSFETTIRDIRFEETDEDTMIWESELEKGLEEIIKSSPNIIDLIEVGDYVNGYKVIDIVKGFKVIIDKLELDTTTGLYHNIGITNIKSVITREQMKSLKYKVKE